MMPPLPAENGPVEPPKSIDTANDALAEILRAFEAWDNDEPFEGRDDPERAFDCDAVFVEYMARVAERAYRGTP